jgi:signal recognition particle receptor subunit beta
MALINHETRTIHCKIVYYGPGMAGKTSNLQYIHHATEPGRRGELLSIATETERKIFFEFTPDDDPTKAGHKIRFHLYTTPGSVLHPETKVAVLNKADGVVFVADSQRDKLEENIYSLTQMIKGLYSYGQSVSKVPVVLQYNKRDLPNVLPVETLDKYLNSPGWPRFETIIGAWMSAAPLFGHGVLETFATIQRIILEKLQNQIPEGTIP